MASASGGSFAAEAMKIDGTSITVNWQNLSTADQATITAGTSANATAINENAAATLMVNTINSAIDASGVNIAHVSGYVANGALSIQSGSTGINSSITATQSNGILATALNANGGTATGTDVYSGTTFAATTKAFNATINGIQMSVTTTIPMTAGTTSMASAATALATNINTAIDTYNTGANLVSGQAGYINHVTVNATSDGRFQVGSESGAISFSDNAGATNTVALGLNATSTSSSGGALTFQIGANSGQTMGLSISDMRASALGVANIDLSTDAGASAAITAIDKATSMVSAQRSNLGAVQNRLQDESDNLQTSSQNITTAEANIRDVDMAAEMTNFQKNNVLSQAA
jgi:flagellin